MKSEYKVLIFLINQKDNTHFKSKIKSNESKNKSSVQLLRIF
jgi:hypothetical protein